VAVALPHAAKSSGLVWRLARQYDSRFVRQISEADVDTNVVLVFKVLSRGQTTLVLALARGDTSSKAVKSATHRILSR
jgi:tRNA A37 threonylcarbamoyladenosine biosynthesis protein TsaE